MEGEGKPVALEDLEGFESLGLGNVQHDEMDEEDEVTGKSFHYLLAYIQLISGQSTTPASVVPNKPPQLRQLELLNRLARPKATHGSASLLAISTHSSNDFLSLPLGTTDLFSVHSIHTHQLKMKRNWQQNVGYSHVR